MTYDYDDPIAAAAQIPPAMVAAALSRPNGAITVLAGTELAAWVDGVVEHAVRQAVSAAYRQWIAATDTVAADAADEAVAATADRWDRIHAEIASASRSADRGAGRSDEPDLVRRTTLIPRPLATALKAAAACQGLTQQDAITEAIRLWVHATQTGAIAPVKTSQPRKD